MSRIAPAFWSQPFAHRGLHSADATENSSAAIKAAADAGYGIEIDIQPARDGTPMVFHDFELGRLTNGAGKIAETRLDELNKLHLACGGGIPTLSETLGLLDGRSPLLVELKDQTGEFGPRGVGPFEQAVATLCGAYVGKHGANSLAVMSFNPHSALWFQQHAPQLLRGVVSSTRTDAKIEDSHGLKIESIECDFLSHRFTDLPSEGTTAMRQRKSPVFCWTIRSEEEAQQALRHCNQITFEGYRPLQKPS